VSARLRGALGIKEGELLLLQPTRIVPRKRIERAIEIVRRLGMPAVLLITHHAGDEGHGYADYLHEFAQIVGARVIFAADRVAHVRRENPDGQLGFSLADAYQQADLVTYPSAVEGFGNAFLETVYYQRPIMMADYEIFAVDIKPKGFRVITFGEYVSEEALSKARAWLADPAAVAEVVQTNYDIARRHYSYRVLEGHLALLLNESLGT
jgi:glycosyltransferase involved in cell wall biosynthesis